MTKFFYIAGPFGSGTTAMAGALASAGVVSLPPHFMTNDERTPNSYESMHFRGVINRYVNETQFNYDASRETDLIQELSALKDKLTATVTNRLQQGMDGPGASAFLKMPISALCLAPIIEVFDPYIVLMQRPFCEIEASRIRRSWPPAYGREGADLIYSALNLALTEMKRRFIEVEYRQFLVRPVDELNRVFDYAGIEKGFYDIETGAWSSPTELVHRYS